MLDKIPHGFQVKDEPMDLVFVGDIVNSVLVNHVCLSWKL